MLTLAEIKKRYERYKRKKEFIRKLKEGEQGTDDPGPYRVALPARVPREFRTGALDD